MGSAVVLRLGASASALRSLPVVVLLIIAAASVCSAPGRAEESAAVSEPKDYRLDNYRTPVPQTLAGARTIAGEEAEALWREKTAVFIDVYPRAPKPDNLPAGTVWRDVTHMSMEGGHWLPNVGYGVLSPVFEAYFRTHLERLTGGDKSRAVVFYCLKDCWMSWNAAKRAVEWGYNNVIWFRDGTDAWQALGYDLVRVEPEP